VAGDLVAYAVVAREGGDALARVQQRAEAIWPPGAGGSVRAVTVPVDETLAEQVSRLLVELGWTGLAQVQFISGKGEPALLDLNGRFYGSLELAVAAGVDLAAVWAAQAAGRPAPTCAEARVGVRYHSLEGDLRRVMARPRAKLLREVLGCAGYARGATPSIWRADDPWPGLRYSAHLARRLASKPWRHLRGRRGTTDAERSTPPMPRPHDAARGSGPTS
jgi:predicted ATP-grasp superfamily ATP-dependent carboligase